MKLRIVFATVGLLFIVGLLVASQYWSSGTPNAATPAEMASQDCAQCHQASWQQWQASKHAVSWTSPDVQGAFAHFGHDRKCESCHAPQPVLVSGLENEVLLRAEDRDSGVNCLSCHATSNGGVAATRTLADAPCRPVLVPELRKSEHCGGCHVAIYDDWKQSRYLTENKTCQSCHMSTTDQGTAVSHRCAGGDDASLVRGGVRMQCNLQNDAVHVAVTNHATGHNFPGERHNRVLLIQVMQRKADGTITSARQETIKHITPFRGETSAEQIRVDQTFEAEFPVAERPAVAEVKLLYKRFPWQSDEQALVVHQETVKLD